MEFIENSRDQFGVDRANVQIDQMLQSEEKAQIWNFGVDGQMLDSAVLRQSIEQVLRLIAPKMQINDVLKALQKAQKTMNVFDWLRHADSIQIVESAKDGRLQFWSNILDRRVMKAPVQRYRIGQSSVVLDQIAEGFVSLMIEFRHLCQIFGTVQQEAKKEDLQIETGVSSLLFEKLRNAGAVIQMNLLQLLEAG